MADDRADQTPPPDREDAGVGARRPPPTIELAASEFSADSERSRWAAGMAAMRAAGWAIAAAVVAAALTAAAVAGLVVYLGASGVPDAPPAASVPDPALAMLSDLSARLKRLESAPAPAAAPDKPAATDAELVARLNVAEQALHAVREQIAGLRRQADTLASAVNELKQAPRAAAAPSAEAPAPDIAAFNEKLAEIERALGALEGRIGDRPQAAAGERELRRIVAAMLLDTAARNGAPYAAELAMARRLAAHPEALAPLEAFAATGIPDDAALCAMLAPLVPQLAAAPAPAPPAGTLWERLRTQATALVRIRPAGERPGTDVAAIASRIDAAVKRNDASTALRELASLPPERRAVADAVIARAAARAAAFEATRQFLADSMTAFADTSLVKTAP